MRLDSTVANRFWAKVHKSGPTPNHMPLLGPCWLWQGKVSKGDYGRFVIRGSIHKSHRLSWIIHFGDIPDGMCVCHRCDNRQCVNPHHLFIGTKRDNSDDMIAKGRSRKAQGSGHHHSKLTEHEVVKIRLLAKTGLPHREIAREFGVQRATVSHIVRRIAWTHV